MSQAGAGSTYFRLSAFSAAMTVGIGITLPFFPVWLAAQHLDDSALALVVAIPLLVRIITNPVIAAIADRRAAIPVVLAWCTSLTCLFYALLDFANGFWLIFAGVVCMSIAQGPILSLADALIFACIRQRAVALDLPQLEYGSIRAWGSVAVFCVMLAGGPMIGWIGARQIVTLLTIMAAATAIVAWLMAATLGEQPQKLDGLLEVAGVVPRKPLIILIITAAALIQASHALNYTFATLDWQAQGLSADFIGIAWAAGVFTEILFFLFGGRAIARLNNGALLCLALGGGASAIRWSVMMLAPGPGMLLILQMGHGLSFAATHLGAVSLLSQLAQPQHRAQAQAWLGAAISLALFLAISLCGPLHENFGMRGYGAMVAIALAGLGLALLAGQRRHQSLLPRKPSPSGIAGK